MEIPFEERGGIAVGRRVRPLVPPLLITLRYLCTEIRDRSLTRAQTRSSQTQTNGERTANICPPFPLICRRRL